MLKVLHVIFAVSVLWISIVICQDCLHSDRTWGSTDPTKVFFCNQTTNKSEVANCETGRGYVSNSTTEGCVPWEDWNSGCVLRKNVSISCSGSNSLSPQPVPADPTAYFLCASNNSKPIVLQCENDTGFVAYKKYLGCMDWDLWRNVTGCKN